MDPLALIEDYLSMKKPETPFVSDRLESTRLPDSRRNAATTSPVPPHKPSLPRKTFSSCGSFG